ncbi:hypothetical protein D9757_015034 [Collybiopsis confluens]|uniref:DUF6598 domain-containing protein n=1 Tax=Collybiopsis confluens TaxID=2823264 RepID=A0A8H5CH63_9AGAR|nr:hypothetical protein D9757_015034 [Collybiopsis confluens]
MGDLPTGFDFDDGTAHQFMTFIQAILDGVCNSILTVTVGQERFDVRVLAPQARYARGRDGPPTFDLRLTGHDETVVVRIRRDNLYLIGFQPHNGGWHELAHGAGPQLIPGPQSCLSEGTIMTCLAIRALATFDQTPRALERGVLTLIIVIAEATRFTDIAQHIHDSWWTTPSPTLGGDRANLTNNWAGSSTAFHRYPTIGDFLLPHVRLLPNILRAVVEVAIILAPTDSSGSRPKRSIAADISSLHVSGQPLLEIFSIMVDNIDNENPGELYGTISVTDSAGTESIWKRDSKHYVKTTPGDLIVLEGPSRPLYAADGFIISLDLWDSDLIWDDSIAKGTRTFNPFDYYTKYNEPQREKILGKNGWVTLEYIPLSNALYAQITVLLKKGGSEYSPEVYGDISAYNGHGTSSLYHKTSKQYSNVNVGTHIPLPRNLVAVPTNRSLRIVAKLWDHDPLFDDKIADGYVDFHPLYKKSEPKTIKGDSDGEIEVHVTWL